MNGVDLRVRVLRRHGTNDSALEELLAYTRNAFLAADAVPEEMAIPLPDEPFVPFWEGYVERAAEVGAIEALRDVLVQIRFPIERGMSQREDYLSATRRGAIDSRSRAGGGLELRAADDIRLFIHPTPAGRIPVVVAGQRADFVSLLRALTRRNEPDPVPEAVGACIVAGYNNWDRISRLRREWEREHPDADGTGWRDRFKAIVPRKELYQDRFILLSSGPYSATPAGRLELDEALWRRMSSDIRLEHECAHYFTRRVLGSMKNSLHDELIADYLGITVAAGRFRADWLLHFFGLEDFPRFRPEARLSRYRGQPPLSDRAFATLRELIHTVAHNLEALETVLPPRPDSLEWRAEAIRTLACLDLEELASPDVAERVMAARARAWRRRGAASRLNGAHPCA